MRKLYYSLLLLLLPLAFSAKAEEARLLRFPATNGEKVVFTYAGDLYSVPLSGGLATKLTSHQGMEIFARFSPDGKSIAFTGQYDGNTEVYKIGAEGGIPARLTYTATLSRDDVADRMGPNNIVMAWTPDNKIVYRSRQHSFNDFKGKLYIVNPDGGLSTEIKLPDGGFLSFSPDGKKMAYNRVFREFRTWKYYKGGMADEVWIHDFETRETYQITNNPAQDIFPMWIGEEIFFISDRDRTMNLFVYNLSTGATEKVTSFNEYDTKFPSHHGNIIVFENGGYIYKFDASTRKLDKINIEISDEHIYARPALVDASRRITSADLATGGERVLFSARGEVFSVPTSEGITYNLTKSSGIHERNASWSPDGKQVAWLSDKSGEYEIWISDALGEELPRQLTSGGDTYKFGFEWSPDGKLIAWSDQHYSLYVTDVANRITKKMITSEVNQIRDYSWSPDSKWLAFTEAGENKMGLIKLLNVDNGNIHTVTESWYFSEQPSFSSDGKYLVFSSERSFNPVYGQTEWNHVYINMGKVYMILLATDTPSPLAPKNPLIEDKPASNGDNGKDNGSSSKDKNAKVKAELKPLVRIDLEGIEKRIIELPVEPANYYNISAIGDKIYYNKQVQGNEGQNGLYVYNLKDKKETFLGNYRYSVSADKKKMLVGKDNSWAVIDLPSGSINIEKTLDLSSMTTMVNYQEEWQQIFDEAWRQMRDFFYVDNMHGLDWDAIYKKYNALIPYVAHRSDLNYVIGEMIGELNVGHAYVNPGEQPASKRIQTGLLGARISAHSSGFFRIDRILPGTPWNTKVQSPLAAPGVNIKEGEYIVAVNRVPANSVNDIYKLLVGTAGKVVELSINSKPELAGARNVLVTTIADESQLYYYAWVSENIRKVNEDTNGEVGYIHIPDMGPEGLNEFVKYFYPQLSKKALIIDDRGNGGGNVSPMILERLNRKPYRLTMRRNSSTVSTVPSESLAGPMAVLIDKYSASDGDLFPYGFRKMGLGTIIGTRSWGGVVGISSPLPFIDGTDLRVPQFTSFSLEGNWIIEGHGVEPDIYVENDPYSEYFGEDAQLNKAIEVILEELKERKELPAIPAPPVKTN